VVILVIIMLSLIELHYNIHKSKIHFPLPKQALMLTPQMTHLNDPIYVYACGKIKRKQIIFHDGFNENHYIKRKVQNHVGDKIKNGINSVLTKISHLPNSTPINTLYDAALDGTSLMVNADPTTPFKLGIKHYCVLISKRDNELVREIFICQNNIFFII
jgi:hypothetical protein